jgi:hypothetical protein
LSVTSCGDSATFCSGEYYGEGSGVTDFEYKQVEFDGVTCKDCLEQIKNIQSIKLNKN